MAKLHPDKVRAVRQLAEAFCEKDDAEIHKACIHHAVAAKAVLGARIVAGSASWRYTEVATGTNPTHFSYVFEVGPAKEQWEGGVLPEMHVWSHYNGGVLDLTTRYLPEQCQELAGLTWDIAKPPDYFFGKSKHKNFKWAYKEHPTATALANLWAGNLVAML